MRVQLFISAKDLPEPGDTFASVAFEEGDVIGTTEVVTDSANPDWEKGVVFDDSQGSNVTITVCSEGDGELGNATFDVGVIMEEPAKAIGQAMESGSTIFVYATEYIPNGNLQYQICGKDLKNTEGFLGLGRAKSDPFHAIRGTSGDIVYTSEVITDNLDPIWPKAEIELAALCDGDLDGVLEFSILDQDPDGKNDLMGSFKASVNELLSKCESGEEITLTRRCRETGTVLVLAAELTDYTNPKEAAREATSAAVELMAATAKAAAAQEEAEAKSEAAAAASKEAEAAEAAAVAEEEKAQISADELAAAEIAALEAEEAANEAANAAATQTATGTFTLQIRGQKLKNTEGFFRKPDPFFVLKKAIEDDGEAKWSVVYTSNVIRDTLDPLFPEVSLEMSALCNKYLDEPLRVVFYDQERDGKHELMGYFDASVSELQAAKCSDGISMKKGGEETGLIFVSAAELSDYVDPKVLEDKAKEMNNMLEEAKFFVVGKKMAAKIASEKAEAKREIANEKAEKASAAAEEAEAAKEAAEQAAKILADLES